MADFTVGEYETGWYVESPDSQNIDRLTTNAGPFPTEKEANDWVAAQALKASIPVLKNKLARARQFAAQAESSYGDKYTGLMAALEKARADWEKENSLIVAEYERTKKAAEAADKELRAELVEFYKLTREKKFDEHLSVRVLIKLTYELEKATEWAKNNAPYMLIADKSQFEKYAKDKKVSLDFVTKKDEPAGVVASVLPMIEDAQGAD